MSTNDLSNKQQMVYDYFKELMKVEFPLLDLSDTGAFMETFGLPQLKLLEPIFSALDRLTLMQSIENAALLTDDEMDIVAGKYYMPRMKGLQASGTGTLIFRDIPQTNVLQIAAGIVGISKQGYRFISPSTVNIDINQLGNYYDAGTFRFRIPVNFTAQDVGAQYNIDIGDLSRLETPLLFLESVTNEAKFTGGTDKESNIDLATRISKSSGSATLGNTKGYNRFFRDNFTDIKDVLIAGYGHPLMQRDIIGTAPTNALNQTLTNVHWGSKIDAYIRGARLADAVEFLTTQLIPSTSNIAVLLTMVPVADIKQVSRVSSNPNVDPATLVVTNYTILKDENPETVGTLYETAWLMITDSLVPVGTNIQVSYHYNALLTDINTSLYTADNRPPTADVLLKEAHTKYIFGGMIVKQLNSIRLRDVDKSIIRQRAFDYITSLPMGGEIQYSDVTDAISNADPTNPVIDYIHMPTQFIMLANNSKFVHYCQDTATRAVLSAAATDKPFFQTMLTAYSNRTTIYDFFDCLHLLVYDQGLDDAIAAINNISLDWTNRTTRFLLARDMIAKAKLVTLAAPAVTVVQGHEFFDLGELSIYEDKPYSQTDWMNLITLFETLANITANSDHTNDIFSLTCFCISIVYLSVNAAKFASNRTALYLYFHDLSRNTPIQDQFS